MPAATIRLVVNGEPMVTAASTLAGLLADAGYGEVRVATARNGDFVPERLRASTRLDDGDQIEIVSPRQGG
jgi:sulfur carrier protein